MSAGSETAFLEAVDEGYDRPQYKRPKPETSSNAINDKGFSECFRVVRTSMYVSLAPCHIGNPVNGIKAQHLDPLIMTYYHKARGVVLSYFNIDFKNKDASDDSSVLLAKVSESSPFSFMWITVDLLIWHPRIGDSMEGYVYMQTESHIGLLIHDTFNASIKYRNIPQDWEFVPSQADEYTESESERPSSKFKSFGNWVDGSGAKIEGKLSFTIRAVHTNGRMVSLEGTLLTPERELDALPVSLENAGFKSEAPVSTGKHITFDDEPIAEVSEVTEAKSDVVTSDGTTVKMVNSSSSEENEDLD